MKLELLIVSSGREAWLQEARDQYAKKLKAFCDFSIIEIKSKNISRGQSQKKIKYEEELLLKKIDATDLVCLLDENGRQPNSIEFSQKLTEFLESGKRKVIFIIGGAFGVSDAIKERADYKWALSNLVYSHHIAQVVCLEQIYRGFSIINGLPYHNK